MAEPLQVKICGLTRREDVVAAAAAGADYVGVVVTEGFGRSVPMTRAADLVADVRPVAVAVTVDETPERAAALARALGAGVVQLHGQEPPEAVEALRTLGSWRIWKAVRVRVPEDLMTAAIRYGDAADALLVEGWREGVVGGGGVRADLAALENVRATLPPDLPLVLAGGLTPDTVAQAVARFRPAVVDVSSGVEERVGVKSQILIERFVIEARSGLQNPEGVPPA